MAIQMQISGLSKSYGDRMLLADIDLSLGEGDKVGIVAPNGTGKSTLLDILAGREVPDSGEVTLRSGIRVGYLPQHPVYDPELTVGQVVVSDEARRLLSRIGVADMEQRVATLSGGQIKRIALALTLTSEADILILDEPTNHLDIDVIEWLEGFLRRSRVTLLMVTHDRYFLDRVCNKILEIDQTYGYLYEGNYEYYLRRRAERIEAFEAETRRVKNVLRREQDWMNRQPQARAGKAKYRIDQYYKLRQRAAQRRDERQLALDVQARRIGSKIFEAEHISKSFGDKTILRDFNYTFARGEKIGIVGPNGVGKTTFIRMLLGLEPADAGEWNVGETVCFGYYSQQGIDFDPGQKVIDAVTRIADDIELNGGSLSFTPMQWLQRFLFSVPEQQKYISTLSGGERRRLYLATILMRQPNFLVLDEPTNDLDIGTLEMLEDYLADFGGCAIIVSHDRYFLDEIVDHTFVMEGDGQVRDFPGGYSDYRCWAEQAKAEAAAATAAPKRETPAQKRPRPQDKVRMSFKERREFEALTSEIEALTAEKEALDARFNSGEVIADAAALAARYAEVNELLDQKEMRWLELSEKE